MIKEGQSGECIFCGQIRTIDKEQYDNSCLDIELIQELQERGVDVEDHLSTIGCNCSDSAGYANELYSIRKAYENIEHILDDKKELIPPAKQLAKLMVKEEISKASLVFKPVTVTLSGSRAGVKIERKYTEKEVLEG